MEPLAGDDPAEVAGYRLRLRLGSGGMGRVYLAFTDAGRPVAVKVVRPEFGEDPEFRGRFRQEVAAARGVHGLYTAEVLDADPDARPPWLVTAYVPGPSLRDAVAAHGPLPADAVLMLVAGVAEALQAIHAAGVVHRDLKPSNVLLAADGPRVIDFGIARAAEATAITRTGVTVGSPGFMAPEQVQGQPVSPATDVFALGAVAAHAVLGRPPFGEGAVEALFYRIVNQEPDLGACPPPLRELIAGCLAKQPSERPSPSEVVSQCRRLTEGRTLLFTRHWLPDEIAADLAQYGPPAAPAGPATLTGETAVLTATARPVRGGMVRVPVLAGLAVLLAAVAAVAVPLALRGRGGSPGRTTANDATRSSDPGASRGTQPTSAQQGKKQPGGTTQATQPCIVGAWKGVSESTLNFINGQQVQFNGSGGGTTVYRANGTFVGDSHNGVVLSANVNGADWTETITGTSSGDWTTQGGQLLISNATTNGTATLRVNGIVNVETPVALNTAPKTYVCSGNTLRVFGPNGSVVLTRQTP